MFEAKQTSLHTIWGHRLSLKQQLKD